MVHLLLDIDECLIRTFENGIRDYRLLANDPKFIFVRDRLGVMQNDGLECDLSNGMGDKYWYIARPYLREFLQWAQEYFETVSIWSAGSYDYVHDVTRVIFKDLNPPKIIMTNNDITRGEGRSYWKPLTTFYEKMRDEFPDLDVNETNTVMLDNRANNFIDNEDNGITIPDWDPEGELSVEGLSQDNYLFQLQQWCINSQLKDAIDVRYYDKSKIFKRSNRKPPTVLMRRTTFVKPEIMDW